MGLLDTVINFLGTADLRTQASSVEAWVELYAPDGSTIAKFVPVNFLTCNFPLHGIGTGQFVLNVGYHVGTRQLAAIADALDSLENQVRVFAFVRLKGRNPDFSMGNQGGLSLPFTRRWEDAAGGGIFKVWEGLTLGPGYNRSRDSTSFTLLSRHWLSELDAGTIASQSFIKNAADNLLVAYGVDSRGGNLVSAVSAIEALAGGKPPGDLWRDVMLPMLLGLMTPSGQTLPAISGTGGAGSGRTGTLQTNGQMWETTVQRLENLCRLPGQAPASDTIKLGNDIAADILTRRIATPIDGGGWQGVPFALPQTNGAEQQIIPGDLNFTQTYFADRIRNYIANVLASRMGSPECLEKIISVASLLMFKLVANVDAATLAPHVPVIHQSKVWRDIPPCDYTHVRGQGSTPRRLAGVGLVGSSPYRDAVKTQGVNDRSSQGEIVGIFRRSNDGQLMLVPAPDWLHYMVPPEQVDWNVRSATQAAGATQSRPDPDPEAERKLGCRLARAYWYDEVYRNRYAELSGKLRFDIGPGSIVRVLPAGIQVPQLGRPLYGCVQNVVLTVDANDPQCGTTFGLSHLRHEEKGGASADWADVTHPVYTDQAWYGSPLIRLYATDLTPQR